MPIGEKVKFCILYKEVQITLEDMQTCAYSQSHMKMQASDKFYNVLLQQYL